MFVFAIELSTFLGIVPRQHSLHDESECDYEHVNGLFFRIRINIYAMALTHSV